MEKYMFLYLKTGGGHYSPAKAIADTIKDIKGENTEIILHDGLTGTKTFVRRFTEDGYRISVNKALWLFELLYAINKINLAAKLTTIIAAYFIKPALSTVILKEKPCKIIIFHYSLIRPVNQIIKENRLDIPTVAVVTDPFTAPTGWFTCKDQNYIVFSDMLKNKCLEKGIKNENINLFPFVTGRKFSAITDEVMQLNRRKNLGFREDSKIILIMGGGEGLPNGKKIFKNIISAGIDAEIAVVCGRDKKLFKQATDLKTKYNPDNTRVFRFVDFACSLISISDVVITKAGASLCMEILLAEKIPVITSYIWEQEKGNMEFIRNGKMGIYIKNPRKLPDVINRLLNDNEYHNHIIENIRRNEIRNGLDQVSDYIIKFN